MNTSFFGRLTKDAETKTSQGGTQYTTFTVATQLPTKDDTGNYKTLFVHVAAFGRMGETIARNFTKGSRIVVHGEIRDVSAWTDNQGAARPSVAVSLNGFDFVDTRRIAATACHAAGETADADTAACTDHAAGGICECGA